MKKIISTILLIVLLSSCSFFKKEEKIENTSSWEIIETEQDNWLDVTSSSSWTTSSWEIVTVEQNDNEQNNVNQNNVNKNDNVDMPTSNIKITTTTETDVSVEKDIENIIDTNEETSKDSVTEEEILNDIDSLINDIIKSAENG